MLDIIRHPRWLHNATAGLSRCLRGDLPLLMQQVNRGIAQLWEINTDQGRSWMVSRIEKQSVGDELVICCYEGCDLQRIAPIVFDHAKQQGFQSIRFHTRRQGLNRLIKPLGFSVYETVFKASLSSTDS